MKDYLSEDAFYAYKDELLEKLRTSESILKLVEKRQSAVVSDADLMLQVGYNYYEVDHVSKWKPLDLEDYALSHLPRKYMAGPGAFEQMGKNLIVFVKWLYAEQLVDNGEALVAMMREVAPQMAKASKRY